jgi:hypothetical protein
MGAIVSVAFGACAKIAAQLRTTADPSPKSLDRIDIFTVKASSSTYWRRLTTSVPKTGVAGA